RCDEACIALMHVGGGLALEQFAQGLFGQLITVVSFFRHNVQQNNLDPGIGDVGSDATAHDARADDCNAPDITHESAPAAAPCSCSAPAASSEPAAEPASVSTRSSTVAMPCPPPIHMVASA